MTEDVMSERISSFKDLRVYQVAFELQRRVFALSKAFPAEERPPPSSALRPAD
jgi:hypothetical protein